RARLRHASGIHNGRRARRQACGLRGGATQSLRDHRRSRRARAAHGTLQGDLTPAQPPLRKRQALAARHAQGLAGQRHRRRHIDDHGRGDTSPRARPARRRDRGRLGAREQSRHAQADRTLRRQDHQDPPHLREAPIGEIARSRRRMTLSLSSAGADRSHIERRNAILAKYPQVRELFGTDILTFKITVALFFLQLAIAAFLGRLGLAYWPLTLLLAYCVGAFANHANFVIIHDSIHNCVFKNHLLNKLNALLADLSNGFPTAMGFRCYHIKHHSHLSAYDYDADVPSHWEVEWVGDSSWRKAAWLFFFPAIQLM